MSEPRQSMTAFVTSDVLDHDSLQAFLAARENGGNVRWRGMCWEVLEHQAPDGHHSFRLGSVPREDCGG